MSDVDPFVFLGCLELRELLDFEAHDVRELGEQLERVPAESVFCHMAAVLMHRSALTETYPNDFALWVGSVERKGFCARCALLAVHGFATSLSGPVKG